MDINGQFTDLFDSDELEEISEDEKNPIDTSMQPPDHS